MNIYGEQWNALNRSIIYKSVISWGAWEIFYLTIKNYLKNCILLVLLSLLSVKNIYCRPEWFPKNLSKTYSEFLWSSLQILARSGVELIHIRISVYCCSIPTAPSFLHPTTILSLLEKLQLAYVNYGLHLLSLPPSLPPLAPLKQQQYTRKSLIYLINGLIRRQHFTDLHQISFKMIVIKHAPSFTTLGNKLKLWHNVRLCYIKDKGAEVHNVMFQNRYKWDWVQ